MERLVIRQDLFNYAGEQAISHAVGYSLVFVAVMLVIVAVSVFEARMNEISVVVIVSLVMRLAAAIAVIVVDVPLYWLLIVPVVSPEFLISLGESLRNRLHKKAPPLEQVIDISSAEANSKNKLDSGLKSENKNSDKGDS